MAWDCINWVFGTVTPCGLDWESQSQIFYSHVHDDYINCSHSSFSVSFKPPFSLSLTWSSSYYALHQNLHVFCPSYSLHSVQQCPWHLLTCVFHFPSWSPCHVCGNALVALHAFMYLPSSNPHHVWQCLWYLIFMFFEMLIYVFVLASLTVLLYLLLYLVN